MEINLGPEDVLNTLKNFKIQSKKTGKMMNLKFAKLLWEDDQGNSVLMEWPEKIDTKEDFLEKVKKQKRKNPDFDEEMENLDEKYANKAGLRKLV